MSAWAEAAWIISELNNRFDFSTAVSEYQNAINDDREEMQQYYQDILNKNTIIVSATEPSQEDLVIGTLWFNLKS